MLYLNTIYTSFMGECNEHGIGTPCTFVRLAGCNLSCYSASGHTCDTPEALSVCNGEEISEEDLYDMIWQKGRHVVCITGGEPLCQDLTKLLELLTSKFSVVIETNGSMPIKKYLRFPNVSFVVDVKAPSTGEADKMCLENYQYLKKKDFLKFVIRTREDFEYFYDCLYTIKSDASTAVGTFWGGEVSYADLLSELKKIGTSNRIHLNMQTHKMTYLYDKFKDEEAFKKLFIPKDV